MKKLTLIFIAIIGATYAQAQNINPENGHVAANYNAGNKKVFKADSLLSQWCIDVNVTGGALKQKLTVADPSASYLNALNKNISDLKFSKGSSFGFDMEAGYFFDKKRNFGAGVGIWYMRQKGNLVMDNFSIDYQSVDKFGNIFRQRVSANHAITESIKISNFNIPLLVKYKMRFSKQVGFTADAGLMINISEKITYSSDASFDYEAIYKYSGSGSGVKTVYDNSTVPGASDLLITKSQYASNHSGTEVANYFNTLSNGGYNVGLGVTPANNSGDKKYSGSVGLLLRPAVSIYFSDNLALNLGVYYLYQGFKNNSAGMLTDKVGSYTSLLNGVSKSGNSSYGISVGIRYFIEQAKHEVPAEPELAPEEEKTAEVTPPAPKEEAEETPEPVTVSTPILFDLNKTEIKRESYPVLDEAINELNQDKKAQIVVHGYTDITGTAAYNKSLSKKRANEVKKLLVKKGAKPKSIKTIGHGAKTPAASNSTEEGRAKNRRAVMKVQK